jgi:hypothetical protein
MAKKKVKTSKASMALDKATMNKIIKKMAKMQNEKSKLNAGQLREVVKLFLAATMDEVYSSGNTGLEVTE